MNILGLRSNPGLDEKLRNAEASLIEKSYDAIKEVARHEGLEVNKRSYEIGSEEDACQFRYVYVPLLYRLGFTEKAAALAQDTFQYLFPKLNAAVEGIISSYLKDVIQIEEVLQPLMKEADAIQQVYFRKKSNHSIWRKVSSIEWMKQLSQEEMGNAIYDLIGIRWIMKVLPDENAFDGIMNGLRLAPDTFSNYRNQMHKQLSGFDLEPIIKLRYQIEGVPIELQILAGQMEGFMAAKAYSNYKVGYEFPPTEKSLGSELWNQRLGLCLEYCNSNNWEQFHQLMLDELLDKPVSYNPKTVFELPHSPLSKDNRDYRFHNCPTPAWKIPRHQIAAYP